MGCVYTCRVNAEPLLDHPESLTYGAPQRLFWCASDAPRYINDSLQLMRWIHLQSLETVTEFGSVLDTISALQHEVITLQTCACSRLCARYHLQQV